MHLLRNAHVPMCRCLSVSGQVSCPVSAFAGDGKSILLDIFSVFTGCGLTAVGKASASPALQTGQHSPGMLSQAEECVVFTSLAGKDFPGSREEPCPGLRYWIQLNSRLGRHFVLDLLIAAASPKLFLSVPSVSDNVQSY